jgi:hypothetical protein
MSQCIIFTNEAGGVSVTIPTGEISIEAVQAKDTPAGSLIVNTSDLPTDNHFFDAWELADGVVTVSLAKAKEITKKRLRAEREPLLAAQDVLFQRAQEANSDTTAIVAEKQRLRDVTSLADAETTLEGLRAIKV